MLSACHLFSQLRVLVSVRNNGTNFAWHGYVICFRRGRIGHWRMFEKLPQNLNTSNNSPYPQPISLLPHIWQPQSFPFKHKYCSSLRRRPSHGNPLPSLKRHPPSQRSPKNKLTSPLASRKLTILDVTSSSITALIRGIFDYTLFCCGSVSIFSLYLTDSHPSIAEGPSQGRL